ncbi:MAG: carbohydrate porin [Myxococcales bacterium]|nr:carbohydrate porin [Myxococcales bacterium]MCB9520578.1 carbohydrate porin [Myxococcales bacterium]MCB9531501.1 carbohydrate porin [Myxococcales bacterium]
MKSQRLARTAALLACVAAAPAATQELAQQQTEQAEIPAASAASPSPLQFRFGSYGRVVGASDLRGGAGHALSVVSHGPRLEEASYVELDFQTRYTAADDAAFDTVLTLALTDALFHLDGDFDGAIALRNAYVEAREFGVGGLSIWAGSRMLRGDDIYLLDFWPLDELNTVGGGARYDVAATNTTVSLHGGVNQLHDTYQYQTLEVAGPSFATEELLLLDRTRAVGSLRLEQRFENVLGATSAKVVVYAEGQGIGSGEYDNADDVRVALPADHGYAVGGQIGMWGFGRNAFANAFVRYARGLSAYGVLAVPVGLDTARRAAEARSVRVAVSGNYETRWVGATVGGYVQWFDDADSTRYDPDDYTETVLSLRPVVFVTDHFHQAFEASFQRRVPEGLSARTDTYLEPAIIKLAALPTLSVDRGVYARPQIRLIYSVSFLNEGAQAAWPDGDRRTEPVQHYLGVGAEWWFNSSSYQ